METNIFDELAAAGNPPLPSIQPCPFCHSPTNAIKLLKDIDGNTQHAVFCPRCDAHGPKRSTEREAITAWNRSKEPA